jgi:hypothetical protein
VGLCLGLGLGLGLSIGLDIGVVDEANAKKCCANV